MVPLPSHGTSAALGVEVEPVLQGVGGEYYLGASVPHQALKATVLSVEIGKSITIPSLSSGRVAQA